MIDSLPDAAKDSGFSGADSSGSIVDSLRTVSPWSGFIPASEIDFQDVLHMNNMQLMDNAGATGTVRTAATVAAFKVNPIVGLLAWAVPEGISLMSAYSKGGDPANFFGDYKDKIIRMGNENSKMNRFLEGSALGGNLVSGTAVPEALSQEIRSGENSGYFMTGEGVSNMAKMMLTASAGGQLFGGGAIGVSDELATGFMTTTPFFNGVNEAATKYGEGYNVADSMIYGGAVTGGGMLAAATFFKALPRALSLVQNKATVANAGPIKSVTGEIIKKVGRNRVQNVAQFGGWGGTEQIVQEVIRSGAASVVPGTQQDPALNIDWKAQGEQALLWSSIGLAFQSPALIKNLSHTYMKPFKTMKTTRARTHAILSRQMKDNPVAVADDIYKVTRNAADNKMFNQKDVLAKMVSKNGIKGTKTQIKNELKRQQQSLSNNAIEKNILTDMLDDVDRMNRKAFDDSYIRKLARVRRDFIDMHHPDKIKNLGVKMASEDRKTFLNYYNDIYQVMAHGKDNSPEAVKSLLNNTNKVLKIKDKIKKQVSKIDLGFSFTKNPKIPGRIRNAGTSVTDIYESELNRVAGHGGVINDKMQKHFNRAIDWAIYPKNKTKVTTTDILDATDLFYRYVDDGIIPEHAKEMSKLRQYVQLKELLW